MSPKRFGTAKHVECQAANKVRVKPLSRPASSITTVDSAFVGCFLLWPIWWSLAAVTSGLWSGDTNLELKLQPSGTSWLIQAHCFPPLALLPQPTTLFAVVRMLYLTAVCCHRSQIRLQFVCVSRCSRTIKGKGCAVSKGLHMRFVADKVSLTRRFETFNFLCHYYHSTNH